MTHGDLRPTGLACESHWPIYATKSNMCMYLYVCLRIIENITTTIVKECIHIIKIQTI
jgi:hypothetical protein